MWTEEGGARRGRKSESRLSCRYGTITGVCVRSCHLRSRMYSVLHIGALDLTTLIPMPRSPPPHPPPPPPSSARPMLHLQEARLGQLYTKGLQLIQQGRLSDACDVFKSALADPALNRDVTRDPR
jgi:hypothetical protein